MKYYKSKKTFNDLNSVFSNFKKNENEFLKKLNENLKKIGVCNIFYFF